MRATCIFNNIEELSGTPAYENAQKYIRKSTGEVDLTVGRLYTIYGTTLREGRTWLYVCQEVYDEYPKAYPLELFKLTDASPSRYWRLNESGEFLIQEWANDRAFIERLVDGEPHEVKHFKEQKTLMDNEHKVAPV